MLGKVEGLDSLTLEAESISKFSPHQTLMANLGHPKFFHTECDVASEGDQESTAPEEFLFGSPQVSFLLQRAGICCISHISLGMYRFRKNLLTRGGSSGV